MKSNSWMTTVIYCGMFLIILYGIAWYIVPEIKIYFYFLLITLIILGVGIATDKYTKIIRACELGVNGVYCKHKSSYDTSDGKVEIFSLAPGVSLTDFEKKKEHISQYLDRDIEFRYDSKCIHMKMLNKANEGTINVK